jgi:hypothetical protein
MSRQHLTWALLALSALTGCTSLDDARSSASGGANDLGYSLGGGFGRNTDTYGTQRRVDVYGGSTAPSLPTIGASGFGK